LLLFHGILKESEIELCAQPTAFNRDPITRPVKYKLWQIFVFQDRFSLGNSQKSKRSFVKFSFWVQKPLIFKLHYLWITNN
jgi:hypothetical protein